MNILDHLRGALRSSTIWFNTVAASIVGALPMLQDSIPALQPYLGPNLYRYAMGGIIAANILLRIKTNASLADKVKP